MPFMTKIRSGGGAPSYDPAFTETTKVFIVANYGASQGFDNGLSFESLTVYACAREFYSPRRTHFYYLTTHSPGSFRR